MHSYVITTKCMLQNWYKDFWKNKIITNNDSFYSPFVNPWEKLILNIKSRVKKIEVEKILHLINSKLNWLNQGRRIKKMST